MAAIYYSDPILIKFYKHIQYIEKVRCGQFDCNILTNNENWPIVIRYIVPNLIVPTCKHIHSLR